VFRIAMRRSVARKKISPFLISMTSRRGRPEAGTRLNVTCLFVTRVIAVEGLQEDSKIRATQESREFAGLLVGGTMKCPSSSILTVLSVSRMMSWLLIQGGTMSPAASFGRTTSFATAFSIRATARRTRTTTSTTSLRRHHHHHHQSSSRAGSSIIMLVRDRQRRRSINTSSTVVFSKANEPPADAFLTENSNSILNGIPLPNIKHDDNNNASSSFSQTAEAGPGRTKNHNNPGDNHGRYGKLLQEVGLDHIIAPDTDLPSDRTVSTMDVFCNR
jgi:hypothetical protein